MTDDILHIAIYATPLLLASLGALASERAGVLAVFMDGAITLAGCVAVTAAHATGSAGLGLASALMATVGLLALVAVFTEKTGANPFLTGLSVNLLSGGLTSWISASVFGTRGVVELVVREAPLVYSPGTATILAFASVVPLALASRRTTWGLRLFHSGESPEALEARGFSPARYRVASWSLAAAFAALSGTHLAYALGAFVPSLAAGRGWTALAACYLGNRRVIPTALAVLFFSAAEHAANALQGTGIPGTLILGFPYAISLAAFILAPRAKKKPGW
jgi:simple sugar transport system permease protein